MTKPLLALIVLAMCIAKPAVILAFAAVVGGNIAIGFLVERLV